MYSILVPVDGSAHSDNAVRFAVDIAKGKPDAEISLLTVHIPVISGGVKMFISVEQLQDYYQDEGAKTLASAIKIVEQSGLKFKHHVAVGHIGETIVSYAKEQGCNQIVMGTHGLGSIGTLVIGSVSNKVIHNTALPVTLVK